MDAHQLTTKVMEHEARLAAHNEEIKTLFNQQKNIEKLADSTHDLAKSVEKLTARMSDVDERVTIMESTARKKGLAIWQALASAIIGAAITFLLTHL